MKICLNILIVTIILSGHFNFIATFLVNSDDDEGENKSDQDFIKLLDDFGDIQVMKRRLQKRSCLICGDTICEQFSVPTFRRFPGGIATTEKNITCGECYRNGRKISSEVVEEEKDIFLPTSAHGICYKLIKVNIHRGCALCNEKNANTAINPCDIKMLKDENYSFM